jgi:thioredoxin-related protein
MKKWIVSLFALCVVAQLQAGDLKWETDLPKALEKAKPDNRLVMVDFTGSDWCGWCIKLNKEVFSTPEFAKYAEKSLVPVEVDFPRKKVLPDSLKQANEQLKQKYKIRGYPTIVVLNSSGKEVGRLQYMPGGPSKFIAELEKLRSNGSS